MKENLSPTYQTTDRRLQDRKEVARRIYQLTLALAPFTQIRIECLTTTVGITAEMHMGEPNNDIHITFVIEGFLIITLEYSCDQLYSAQTATRIIG